MPPHTAALVGTPTYMGLAPGVQPVTKPQKSPPSDAGAASASLPIAVTALSKARLKRVSSRTAWGLRVWGSRRVRHTCFAPPRAAGSLRRASRAGRSAPPTGRRAPRGRASRARSPTASPGLRREGRPDSEARDQPICRSVGSQVRLAVTHRAGVRLLAASEPSAECTLALVDDGRREAAAPQHQPAQGASDASSDDRNATPGHQRTAERLAGAVCGDAGVNMQDRRLKNMHMFHPPHHDLTLLPDLQCTPTYLLIVRRRVRPRRPGGHGGVWLDPWREPHSGWRRARPLGTPSRGRRRRHLSGGACARTARRLWFVAGGARLVRVRVKGGYCRLG